MAEMALEDKIQAAVERQVAAVSAGHAKELQNVQEQLQQTLDRRTQVLLWLQLCVADWKSVCGPGESFHGLDRMPSMSACNSSRDL